MKEALGNEGFVVFGVERGVLSDALLAVLACPISHQPLVYVDGALVCAASRRRYRIEGGVPVLLPEEAEELSPADLEALLTRRPPAG
ncbi:MAG TPA: Trm112 family protein [Kofleriaceae bacterium]